MYEKYTHQSLPSKYYRELLGSAICVFNSNNAFIIETVLRLDTSAQYSWYQLIDWESGKLRANMHDILSKECGDEIESLFTELINQRNRIVHSYRITNKQNEQVLATKTRAVEGNKQFEITEEYLLEFIKLNDKLSQMLHKIRGY